MRAGAYNYPQAQGLRGIVAAIAAVFALFLSAGQAAAQADLGAIGPGDLLSIPLDPPLTELAAEVDGIDVSDALRVDGGVLSLRLFVPLDPGRHELVIYALQGSGYTVIGTFTFETFGVAEGDGNTLEFSAEHKIGVRNLNGDSEEFASSAGEFQFSTVTGNVRVGADYLATTVLEDQLTGREVDIGEYYLEIHRPGELFDITGRVGHQSLDYDDISVSDISRRGIGVEVATPDDRFTFGMFASKTTETLGIDNFTGLEEADDRMFGATAAIRPFAGNDLRVSLTGSEARGGADGALTVGEGTSAALGIDGTFNDARGRFSFGAGTATWDEDAEAGAFTEQDGTALLASLDYDLLDGTEGSSLTLGLSYSRVEQDFFTLANPSLPAGQEDVVFSADYAGDALQLTTSLERQTTNVGGPDTAETDRYTTLDIAGSYGTGEVGSTDWTFGLIRIAKDRVDTPPAAPAPEDFDSLETFIGFDRSGERFTWGATYAYLDVDDLSVFNDDATSHTLEGRIGYFGDKGGSLDLALLATRSETSFGSFLDKEAILGFTAPLGDSDWTLIGEAAWQDFGDPLIEDGALFSADLEWAFRPAADLVFSAGYATDALAVETAEDEEWYVGVMLRAQTDVFK